MSEALRLADDLRRQFMNDDTNFDAMIEASIELRRLAAVEQELEALKRAVSEAEPVAWMMRWPNHSPSFTTNKSDYVSWFAGKASYPAESVPLYTLKGIK